MSSQSIEVCISCRDLPQRAVSGVRVALFLCEDNGLSTEIGQTETVVGNINPVFSRATNIIFRFEQSQQLRFAVYRIDGTSEKILETLAQNECAVGEVLSRGGSLELPTLPGASSVLCISARECQVNSQAVRLQFAAHHVYSPSDSCPLNAFFVLMLCPDGEKELLLYKSEAIADKNPAWKSFLVPISHFRSPSSVNCVVKMELYNYNVNAEDKLIGHFTTSLDHLLRGVGPINTYKLSTSDNRKKDHTSVELKNILLVASSSFVDFIKAGAQIHFSVAVDFTASNGNPLDPTSLHYIHPHRHNPYMTALTSVYRVIEKYNRLGRIAALGFGAQIPPDYKMSHLFYMNGDAMDPHVEGVNGLLKAYRSSLLAVRLYGPTDFSEVIYHVYKFAAAVQRQGSSQHYFILLIVTDGCVSDARRTLDAIVACSYLPMSIIIVGVGGREYGPMENLLSPVLKSSDGTPLQREFVTFVKYDSSMTDRDLVGRLLVNVPRQFLTWATLNGITPGDHGKF